MDFEQAKNTVIPFGKFKGETIEHISRTRTGLLWLDWATDIVQDKRLSEAISVFLGDPGIARDLKDMVSEQYDEDRMREIL